MSVRFLVYAFIIFISINYGISIKWGDECLLENGQNGVCVEASRCEQVYKSIKLGVGKLPKLCEYKGKHTTVCCNDKNVTQITGVRSVQACNNWNRFRIVPKISLIIGGGGEPSLLAEFPHMAALGYAVNGSNETVWGCGGSLISLKFILTASHCLNTTEFGAVKYVRLGALNISDSVSKTFEDFQVLRVHRHPLYKRPSKYNDIALLELDRLVKTTLYIQPACLNINITDSPHNLIATGWGLLSFFGRAAEHLQKLYLNHVNNTKCRLNYDVNERSLNKGIQEQHQICAGFVGRDTCKGDSGGPLQFKNPRGTYYIYGITSFGKPCLLTPSPGVYTRVAYYIDWIENIVWPNGSSYYYYLELFSKVRNIKL
ncbi:PREDICTED: serine protease snake-like [Nicrophorus vespilloides]|uniref:Serine protease snake-like n=1 Tax=Nicrophorus vespilloides TaxID=110193 RepID=A0ABM1N2Y3_NICVS|nr:PREDICTED: serine protease snake-like [Nicrophorus vespilloides]